MGVTDPTKRLYPLRRAIPEAQSVVARGAQGWGEEAPRHPPRGADPEEAPEGGQSPSGPVFAQPPHTAPLTPDIAADFLLGYLPDSVQELAREASASIGVPVWQVLLGYVMRVAEAHQLFTPFVLSMWEGGGRAHDVRPCHTCGLPFTSPWPNARFCCNACAHGKLDTLGHTAGCPTGSDSLLGPPPEFVPPVGAPHAG